VFLSRIFADIGKHLGLNFYRYRQKSAEFLPMSAKITVRERTIALLSLARNPYSQASSTNLTKLNSKLNSSHLVWALNNPR